MAATNFRQYSMNYTPGPDEDDGWHNRTYLPQPEQFIEVCQNMERNGFYFTECGQMSKSLVNFAVYTINFYENLTHVYRHLITRSENLYYVELNSTLIHEQEAKVLVFMKPNDMDVYDEEMSYIELPIRKGIPTMYDISYSYTKSSLLTAPYDTDCFNYKTRALDSQAHCFENCLQFACNQNDITPEPVITRNVAHQKPTKVMVTNYDCKLNDTKETQVKMECILELRKACKIICLKRDCTKEIFLAKLEGAYEWQVGVGRNFRLAVKPLNSLSVIITHIPRIYPVDYITYILSTVSFWLGISPLSFMLQFCMKYVQRAFHRVTAHTNSMETNLSVISDSQSFPISNSLRQLDAKIARELAAMRMAQEVCYAEIMVEIASLRTRDS